MTELLNVDVAVGQVLTQIAPLPAEEISITQALGRTLAHTIQSEINLPPFANSSMDGYALRAADLTQASQDHPANLRVVMDIPAGSSPSQTVNPGEAARIMTGAPLPPGADAVVPVEDSDNQWQAGDDVPLPETVRIFRRVKSGDYIRPAGEDIATGQTVLQAGTTLRPQDIGMLVALGYASIPVIRQPRVAIISTGDELVEAGEPLTPGKIRDVNSHTIAGLVTVYGGIPLRLPIARDLLAEVRQVFRDALAQKPDIIISSAGVSVGTYDVVRTVLDELGEISFWRVNLRPGKPVAFGQIEGVPFFGLPGNPVSAMVTFDVFVRPTMLKLQHQPETLQTAQAIIAEDIPSDGRRSYLRVKLSREAGRLIAYSTGTQSSGALMSMVLADALLIVPEDVKLVSAGTEMTVRLLRYEIL